MERRWGGGREEVGRRKIGGMGRREGRGKRNRGWKEGGEEEGRRMGRREGRRMGRREERSEKEKRWDEQNWRGGRSVGGRQTQM